MQKSGENVEVQIVQEPVNSQLSPIGSGKIEQLRCNMETQIARDRTEMRHTYPQLDGLRALAVLLVLFYHMGELRLPALLAYLSSIGWAGVDVFFVLSGFLITTILLRTKPGLRAYGLFVLRRTLRTWPLYFTVLLVSYILLRHDPTGRETNWLQHIVFLQNFAPRFIARGLGPTWSLCIEEHFYILWPLMVCLLPRRLLYWIMPAILLALPIIRDWGICHSFTYKQIYTETQFHLDGLIAGSIIALFASHNNFRSSRSFWVACGCLVIGIGSALLGFGADWAVAQGHNAVFGFTSLAVGFAGLMILLLRDEASLLSRLFSLRPLRYIGRISYGIYLLQGSLISLLDRIPLHRMIGVAASLWPVIIVFRSVVIIGVAALSFHFYESPILRLKDRLR
jgi:peptidoglycan/LPS O-acetylase OafA/YrhL